MNKYFVSWSGGKDSCLALFHAIKKYGQPKYLLNMLTEDGSRSRSHGLCKAVLERQAAALQIPILFYSATWNNYENVFLQALHELKNEGIEMGVFGDIKIPENPDWKAHRLWADRVCAQAGMIAYEPLWEEKIDSLLDLFFNLGFIAKIISVKSNLLNKNYLGKILDRDLIDDISVKGLNPAGEMGEYHSIVLDGPIFTEALSLQHGDSILKDGYWFLDVY